MARRRYRYFYRLSKPEGAYIVDETSTIAFVPFEGDPAVLEERAERIIKALNDTDAIARFNRGDDDRCPTCGNRVDPDGFPLHE